MSVMSKVFHEFTRNGITCKDIVHPWTDSCWKLRQKTFLSAIPGNFKFFLPFIIVRKSSIFVPFIIFCPFQIPAMLKIKQFGPQLVRDSVIHFALVFMNGMITANSVIHGACMWRFVYKYSHFCIILFIFFFPRHFFGYFNYYFFVAVNAFFASFPLVFLPKRIAMTHVIYIYGLVSETDNREVVIIYNYFRVQLIANVN